MNPNSMFSQKALEHLKKQNKSGQAFAITSPTAWIALAAVALSILSILLWSVFGIMADKVEGYGIILNENGAANIAPTSGGRILEMKAGKGQHIVAGESVAVMEQPDLKQEMYLQADQAQNTLSHEDMRNRTSQLASAKEKYQSEANVISPYTGTNLERRQREGDGVSSGTPLYDIRIETGNEDLIALVYVPVLTGSKIKPGMTIQVAPGAVDSSLYGSLVGNVLNVSEYPVPSDRVAYWTGNEEFAKWVVQKCGGAVMEVRVELIYDEETPSGYLWTTILGPDEQIRAGMVCTSTAIVKREAPIVKAFDKLSQWIRSD